MLSAEHRLRHKKDFDQVVRTGAKVFGPCFGMRYGKRYQPDAPTRFGFVVGTKVSKDSVVRNRLKRRMRETMRGVASQVLPGFDVAFIATPEARDLDSAAVKEQLTRLLVKATLLR